MEDLFEQTNAIARKIYEDPTCPPVPFDIFTSAAVGNYDMISGIIKQRKDLNVLNKGGWSPLMYAAYMGHDNVLNLLLEAEADPNFCSEDKLSPLMIAAGCGNESICYFLLQVSWFILSCMHLCITQYVSAVCVPPTTHASPPPSHPSPTHTPTHASPTPSPTHPHMLHPHPLILYPTHTPTHASPTPSPTHLHMPHTHPHRHLPHLHPLVLPRYSRYIVYCDISTDDMIH